MIFCESVKISSRRFYPLTYNVSFMFYLSNTVYDKLRFVAGYNVLSLGIVFASQARHKKSKQVVMLCVETFLG